MISDVNEALERSIILAINAHQGQRDKAGQPYILHLLNVMHTVDDPIAKQAAVLHDYIEDVAGTVEQMKLASVSTEAIEAVVLLTRTPEISYCDYVVKLSHNPIASEVKRADLQDNYRIGRVAYRAGHESQDAMRMQRYALSYQFLCGEIDEQQYRNRMSPLTET